MLRPNEPNPEQAKVKNLADYTPPGFLVDTVDLDISIKDDATTVKSALQVKRNPAATAADQQARCTPIYEEMPGWSESTLGAKTLEELPAAARAYIKRVEELVGAPVDIVSTGPDRNETIVLRHPFA